MSSVQVKDRPAVSKGYELYGSVFKKITNFREEQQDGVVRKQLRFFRNQIGSFREQLELIHQGQPNKTDRLIKLLEDYDTKYDSLVKGLDESFMLFVVGTGKYGKSTLINSLLETEAAEVGVLPKTWKIDIYKKDIPANKVVIRYRNNQEQMVTVKKAKEIIAMEEKKREESDKKVKEKLREYKKQSTGFEAFKEYKLKLEREEIYHSNIVEMHWGMKGAPILEDFYVVDTPGLTQNIMGEVRNSVEDYYFKADGVLWMLDATAIAASNAKKLVEDLEESLSKVGGKQQRNIIAVLNRIDLIHKNQGEEGVRKILADAESIYKGYFRAIIPFSAKQAFDGTIAKNSNLIEKSGMNILQKEIHRAFFKNAKGIQYEKKMQSCYAYNREVTLHLERFIQELEQDVDKYDDGMSQAERQINKVYEKLKDNGEAQITSYMNRVDENIQDNLNTFMYIKNEDEQKQFVNKEIFEIDRLQKLFNDFQESVKPEFNTLVNHFLKKIHFTEYPNLDKDFMIEFQNDIQLHINISRKWGLEGLLDYMSNSGFFWSVFSGFIGIFAKGSIKDSVRTKLYTQLEKIVEEVTSKMEQHVDMYYDSVYEKVLSNANSSFSQVYSFEGFLGEDLEQWEQEISSIIDHGKKLYDILTKPAPNYYSPLREILFDE